MDITTLTSADFKRIGQLLERKEALQAKIAAIDQQLVGVGLSSTAVGTPQAVAKAAKAPKAPKAPKAEKLAKAPKAGRATRMKRGQMKESVIALLKEAGKEGLKVKDIATKLGVKPANVHVWFGSTGKKVAEIKNKNGARVWVG